MVKKKEEEKKEKERLEIEGLGNIFSGVSKMVSSLFNLTGKMVKEGKDVTEREGKIEGKIREKPVKIEYRYRVGIGLRPCARKAEEEFRPYIKKAVGKEEKIEGWKPVLDIFEKPDEIKVVADLPKGTKKRDIKIQVEGNKLKIITLKYSREAQLPCSVGSWHSKLYKTVLEIRLKKKKIK